MKSGKIIALILFSFLVVFSASARTVAEKYPSLYNNEWEKKLKLTAYQQEQIKKIRDDNQEKMNVLLMEAETLHYEMVALAEENDEQIREVLSEKQKVKYDMYQYQLKKQKNEHKGEEKPSRKKMRVY